MRHARTALYASIWLVAGCTYDLRAGEDVAAPPDVPEASGTADAVAPNHAPGPVSIVLTPPAPTSTQDLSVAIVEQAFDPDEGPDLISYVVRWSKDGSLTLHGEMSIPSQFTKRGETWSVEVAAWDSLDEGPSALASVLILNAAPTLSGVTLTPLTPSTEDALSCGVDSTHDNDGDDTSLEYAWFVDDELQPEAHGSGLTPPLPAGSIRCAVRPFDGEAYGDWIGSNTLEVVTFTSGSGLIFMTPKALDLGLVHPGEVSTASTLIRNIGDGPLHLISGALEGDPGFGLTTPLDVTLAPNQELGIAISFTTATPGVKKGKLILETDAMNPSSGKVALLGLGATPCLAMDAFEMNFGGVYAPTFTQRKVVLSSCGALPLVIDAINLDIAAGVPFELDLSQGPGPLPWTLAPGGQANLLVNFSPVGPSDLDDTGKPIAFEGNLNVASNAPGSPASLAVLGFASASGCPVAVIKNLGGPKALPNSVIQLSASDSFGIYGAPSIYTWALNGVPDGVAAGSLLPDAQSPVVSYNAGAPGAYTFHLQVFDQTDGAGGPCGENGVPCTGIVSGCTIASTTVEVTDAIPLVIELLWDTPGDPNQGDEGPGKGADLDLHLHRGGGEMPDYDGDGVPDSFFDPGADCYFFDPSPAWGDPGSADDPVLVLEDPDGGGPERIEFYPNGAGVFTVGVHVWSSFDYGSSLPLVRVRYFGSVVSESQGNPLEHGDLWEALRVHWPSGNIEAVYDANGGHKTTSLYPTAF